MTRRVLTGLVACSLTAVGNAHAQQVRGQLLDGSTRQPIASATMSLIDTAMIIVHRAQTDERGNFILNAPRPGSYFVRGEQLGYRTLTDGLLTMGEGGSVEIGFYLWPQPVELDSLSVETERGEGIVPYLEWQGFYERMKEGFGYFITPEDIEKRFPTHMPDLFQGIPGLSVERNDSLEWNIRLRGCAGTSAGERSLATLYMDGVRVHGLVTALDDIEAVEIYMGPATIPLVYAGTGSCAVVLIWTKH